MLELFPDGFEEVDHADGVELVAYTDAAGEERMWHTFGTARVRDVANDWEERWREFHRPAQVGDVWIGPPWLDPPEGVKAVVIEPARAFGTGGHPTTRLALALLLRTDRGSVLDIGCGSGVLSIAAAKLGFGPVVAVDVDDAAVAATAANAAANGVTVAVERTDARTADLAAVDIALANVTRELAEEVAPRLRSRRLITSGYLVSDVVALERPYRHVERVTETGWAADLFVRE
jgi:ribosomal protein L11 methyltransferase